MAGAGPPSSRRRIPAALAGLLLGAVGAGEAVGQAVPASWPEFVAPQPTEATAWIPAEASTGVQTEPDPARAVNAALSLALPGAGQLRNGQYRGWVYLALEAAAWGAWAHRRHRGGVLRDRYRELAWETGRVQNGPRTDGPFSYYETLTQWPRSGAFDAAAAPGLQPETNPATFNGAIWSLARDLFLRGAPAEPGAPGYGEALAYYRDRAWGEDFLWDWTSNPDAQEQLADLIEESDDRFREATVVLGAVLANHLVAAIDAYLGTPSTSRAPSLRFGPSLRAPAGAWTVSLHFGATP